jgi:hypothetical protein
MCNLTQQSVEDFLYTLKCDQTIAIRPTHMTITRDQVKQFGTPDALSAWDAKFDHNIVEDKMHGQWFLNQLMLQFKPEDDPECWALIGKCHAECFRAWADNIRSK